MAHKKGLDQVVFNRFQGGRNGAYAPWEVGDDQSPDQVNWRADAASLKLRPGSTRINATQLASGATVVGLARWYSMTGARKWWLAAAGTTIYQVSDSGTVTNYGLNLTRAPRVMFAPFRGRQYAVNGYDPVVRIEGGTATDLSVEVLPTPTGPPVVLSQDIPIDRCEATTLWKVPTSGVGRGDYSDCTMALRTAATASPYSGTAFIRTKNTNTKKATQLGAQITLSAAIDFSATNTLTYWVRTSAPSVQIIMYFKNGTTWSGGIYGPVVAGGDVWRRVDFPMKRVVRREDITAMIIRAQNMDPGETFDVDMMQYGQGVAASQQSWYIQVNWSSTLGTKYSPASPRSQVIYVDPFNVANLVQLRGSTNTYADKVGLYRTINGNPDIYYFVTAIADAGATAVTVLDTLPDTSLLTRYDPTTASGSQAPPTGASIIFQHKSRMFYVDPTDPSKLIVSNINDAETCPKVEMSPTSSGLLDPSTQEIMGCYFWVDRDNGQRITGGISIGDVALIVKDRSCYVLYGDSATTWTRQKLTENAGGNSPKGLVNAEGIAAWVDWQNKTFWTWSPSEGLRDIGRPVGDLIGQVTEADSEHICGIYSDRRARWFFRVDGVQEWLEYDFRTGTWYDSGGEIVRSGFMRQRGHDRRVGAIAGGPGDDGHAVFGTHDGRLWKEIATCADGATGVSGVYLMKGLNFKRANRENRIRMFEIEAQGVSGATGAPRLQVGVFVDKEGSLTASPTWTSGVTLKSRYINTVVKVPATVYGSRLQPIIKCTSKTAIEVNSIGILYGKVR